MSSSQLFRSLQIRGSYHLEASKENSHFTSVSECRQMFILDREHVQWTAFGVEFTVHLTKTRRSGPPRKVFYSRFADNSELCPVTVLRMYIDKTAEKAITVGSPKPVFLMSRKPFRRAKPSTIGHWIKDVLHMAGVDTEVFSAHPTSASTSWAASKGIPINDILKAANWSFQTTFEQYYFRPTTSATCTYARTILQSTAEIRYNMGSCFRQMYVGSDSGDFEPTIS